MDCDSGHEFAPSALPQGNYEEAEPLCRRAMEITGETLGEDHPTYAIRLDGLAGVLKSQV